MQDILQKLIQISYNFNNERLTLQQFQMTASLLGRKRSSELGQCKKPNDKKEELLALKSQQVELPLNKEQQPLKQISSEDIKSAIKQIVKSYKKLQTVGSRSKLVYSRQQQNKIIIAEIKALMQKQANNLAYLGVKKKQNQAQCQDFVDEIVKALQKQGVAIDRLYVY